VIYTIPWGWGKTGFFCQAMGARDWISRSTYQIPTTPRPATLDEAHAPAYLLQ
jgi:hypothetical protein